MSEPAKTIFWSISAGLGATCAVIALVFIAGETFGQRCAAAGYAEAAHEACVSRLADGGPVFVGNAAD